MHSQFVCKYGGGGRGHKQGVREPVRLTLCSFLKHLGAVLVEFYGLSSTSKAQFFFAGETLSSLTESTPQNIAFASPFV